MFLAVLLLSIGLSAQPKYIFYMIGDGMGANQVLAAEMYQAELAGEIGRIPTCMTLFPISGQASTYSKSNGITDSAAAGTCLASGDKTTNGQLGTRPDGSSTTTIAEILRDKGWGIGITTSVSIDHATPGAFYAHVMKRDQYYDIGTQLCASGFHFFGGAGFHKPENKSVWQAPNLYDLAEQKGYTIARGYQEGQKHLQDEHLILVQATDGIDKTKGVSCLPYAIDRQDGDLTLAQIVETGIAQLSSQHERFFLMVEGGKIDWSCHGNDAATTLLEVLDFDQAIQMAYRFYLQHPDETLIVVTADHETGGLALGNQDYTLNTQVLQQQKMSSDELNNRISELHHTYGKKLKWEQVCQTLQESLGFWKEVEISSAEEAELKAAYMKLVNGKQKTTKTLYQEIGELSGMALQMINKKAKLGWTTYSHSASAVPVFAIGVGAEAFTGWHDNSEIAPLILKAVEN